MSTDPDPTLPLPLGDAPTEESSLRAAYESVPDLRKRGITFEQALAIPSIRTSLINLVEAKLRAHR